MSAHNGRRAKQRKQSNRQNGKTAGKASRYRRRVEGEVSSGSLEFDHFRLVLDANPGLRRELEDALLVNLMTANPSDPGARFVTGGGVEWIVAATAYAAGVPLLPDGHSATGHDLRGVLDAARELWSVKSQSTVKRGAFRISNGMGGGGEGFTMPTIFLSPNLPGLVYAHPVLHPDVTDAQKDSGDAVTIAHGVIARHAEDHPECVIVADIPANPGAATEDPFLAYSKGVIDPRRFPQLARLFTEVTPPTGDVLSQVQGLVKLRDEGQISQEDYDHLVRQIKSFD
jgi:phage tail protein X